MSGVERCSGHRPSKSNHKRATRRHELTRDVFQRFAPVVDYFQVAVNKIHSTASSPETTSPTEGPKYQYQRAFALSKDLSDQLVTFSAEQINQIKTQNALVRRATEAAQQVSAVASSSYSAAQEKVHAVSDVMLQELQKVQVRAHYP